MTTPVKRGLAIREETELEMLRSLSPGAHVDVALRNMASAGSPEREAQRLALVNAHLLLAQLKSAGVRPDPAAYDAARDARDRAREMRAD
jgi:hypothetical protein